MALSRDAELAQRAIEGDEICRRLLPVLMVSDDELDGSVESLRLIDQRAAKLREIMGILSPAKESKGESIFMSREAVTFMLGAYLGEIARRELTKKGIGVRWEAGGEEKRGMIHSHLVVKRGEQEEKWAIFYDAYEWLNGRSDLVFYDSINLLISKL